MASSGAKAAASVKKPATEKKAKAPKATKEKKMIKGSKQSAPSHPPYFEMIKEAISALHERTGSSSRAIAKYMEDKHKGELPGNFRKVLAVQLRNSAVKGKLVKVKASFKLSDSGKQEGKRVVKDGKIPKAESKKKVAKPKAATSALLKRKAGAPKKKPAVSAKSVVARKVKRVVPVKPKQPKSIKSPAAKKARKVAV